MVLGALIQKHHPFINRVFFFSLSAKNITQTIFSVLTSLKLGAHLFADEIHFRRLQKNKKEENGDRNELENFFGKDHY